MGVRLNVVAATAALAAVIVPGHVRAGEVPDFEPVVTLTTPVALGGEIDAEMACEPTDPGFDGETPIPTFEMVPPGGGGVVAPDSESGDAGTVFATWTATEVGEWGLFVSCGGPSEVTTAIVTAPPTIAPPATEPPATEPPATDPAVTTAAPAPTTAATLPATGAETGTATIAAALVALGALALLTARRRLDA